MKSRRDLLRRSRLYLILDKKVCAKRPLNRLARLLFRAGVGLIQLRDKQASDELLTIRACALAKTLKNTKTLFIVNNNIRVAKLSGSDGVHLGQSDASVRQARCVLGKNKIIGKSCGSLAQAIAAQAQGADYLGIGPVFRSPLKPGVKALGLNTLSRLKGRIHIPYYAIGGINLSNVDSVLETGASGIALCRAVLKAKDIKKTAVTFKLKLDK
ncbi:MAG: thiamine phosphate synthase [Candidatus Omnitrophota bacterium]